MEINAYYIKHTHTHIHLMVPAVHNTPHTYTALPTSVDVGSRLAIESKAKSSENDSRNKTTHNRFIIIINNENNKCNGCKWHIKWWCFFLVLINSLLEWCMCGRWRKDGRGVKGKLFLSLKPPPPLSLISALHIQESQQHLWTKIFLFLLFKHFTVHFFQSLLLNFTSSLSLSLPRSTHTLLQVCKYIFSRRSGGEVLQMKAACNWVFTEIFFPAVCVFPTPFTQFQSIIFPCLRRHVFLRCLRVFDSMTAVSFPSHLRFLLLCCWCAQSSN